MPGLQIHDLQTFTILYLPKTITLEEYDRLMFFAANIGRKGDKLVDSGTKAPVRAALL
jgi:hypothetical protein